MLRKRDDARVVWDHTIRGAESETSWIYGGGTDFLFDRLLKAAMPTALASLEQAVTAGTAAAVGDDRRGSPVRVR